jgi:hypothetical protein
MAGKRWEESPERNGIDKRKKERVEKLGKMRVI